MNVEEQMVGDDNLPCCRLSYSSYAAMLQSLAAAGRWEPSVLHRSDSVAVSNRSCATDKSAYVTLVVSSVYDTGAVPGMKPDATAIGDPQDGRWKITLKFNERRFCIPKFRYSALQQTTRRWRHWWFPTTSCFGVTNHSEAASLWLVRQDRATINSVSPPSCDVTFWQWSMASPSKNGWLASNVSRFLSILCLWFTIHA